MTPSNAKRVSAIAAVFAERGNIPMADAMEAAADLDALITAYLLHTRVGDLLGMNKPMVVLDAAE